jgi:hypothetical protein
MRNIIVLLNMACIALFINNARLQHYKGERLVRSLFAQQKNNCHIY